MGREGGDGALKTAFIGSLFYPSPLLVVYVEIEDFFLEITHCSACVCVHVTNFFHRPTFSIPNLGGYVRHNWVIGVVTQSIQNDYYFLA